jgi:O-methyltransferase
VIKPLVRSALERFLSSRGYRLTASNLFNWPLRDAEFMEIFQRQARFGWQETNGPKIQRMYMVRNLLLSTKGLNGDWAECGVFKGSTSLIMAEYNRRYKLLQPGCSAHLFDSFEGLAEPASADAGTNMVKGDYLGTQGEVKRNLAEYDCFVYHCGWIPDRFPDVDARKFSFVHIDVDFYEPVRDSLDFFLPRMVNGGVVVLDDYGCAQTPGALLAADEMAARYECHIGGLPFGQAFIVVRQGIE